MTENGNATTARSQVRNGLTRWTGLHCNRWRHHDPPLGKQLQSDPIGYGGSPINLCAHAPNPLVEIDLPGLIGCKSDGGESHPKDSDGQERPGG